MRGEINWLIINCMDALCVEVIRVEPLIVTLITKSV